jgi:hypothetical protein
VRKTGPTPRRAGQRRRAVVIGLVVLVLTGGLAGCGGADDPKPTPSGRNLGASDLWLSFEGSESAADGSPVFTDAAGGGARGKVVTSEGGSVTLVEGADGSATAVEFPAVCPDVDKCPRALIEVPNTPELDPGDEPFSYGATVWLAADQTTIGSNIVQSGRFGTDGGQWKLQVDGEAGEPSCVVRGNEPGAEPVVVHSEVSIADSMWHRIVCRRGADGISIEVDGTKEDEPGVTGSVTTPWPIRIGAPGVEENDDQFHGRVDDVYLLIDRG